jgi:uncharacterized membrane protein
MKVFWQPLWGLQALELIAWVASGIGAASAVAFGKWLLALIVALVGLSLILRVRKRLREFRRRSSETTRT